MFNTLLVWKRKEYSFRQASIIASQVITDVKIRAFVWNNQKGLWNPAETHDLLGLPNGKLIRLIWWQLPQSRAKA